MARNNIEVVTGWTNEPHLDIYEASALFRSLIGGEGHFIIVTDENEKLRPVVRADNGITISAGGCYVQGAYMRLPIGQTYICGTTGEAAEADTLASNKSDAIVYAHYAQTEQGDELFFRIYNGTYTEFKNEYPTSKLEDKSINIRIALWSIKYSFAGNQARLDSIEYTAESALISTLTSLKSAILANQEKIRTAEANITKLTSSLSTLDTYAKKLKDNVLNYYRKECGGVTNFTPSKVGTYQDVKINFPAGFFTKKPIVSVMPTTGVPHNVHIGIKELTTSYVTLSCKRDDAKTTTGLNWKAMQP